MRPQNQVLKKMSLIGVVSIAMQFSAQARTTAEEIRRDCNTGNDIARRYDLQGELINISQSFEAGPRNLAAGISLESFIEEGPIVQGPGLGESHQLFYRTDVYRPYGLIGLVQDSFGVSLASRGMIVQTRLFDSACAALRPSSFRNPLDLRANFDLLKSMRPGEYFRFEMPMELALGVNASTSYSADWFSGLWSAFTLLPGAGISSRSNLQVHFFRPTSEQVAQQPNLANKVVAYTVGDFKLAINAGIGSRTRVNSEAIQAQIFDGFDLGRWIMTTLNRIFGFADVFGGGREQHMQRTFFKGLTIATDDAAQGQVNLALDRLFDRNGSFLSQVFSRVVNAFRPLAVIGLALPDSLGSLDDGADQLLLESYQQFSRAVSDMQSEFIHEILPITQVSGARQGNHFNFGPDVIQKISLRDGCGYQKIYDGINNNQARPPDSSTIPFCELNLDSRSLLGLNRRDQFNRVSFVVKDTAAGRVESVNGIRFSQRLFDKSLSVREFDIINNRNAAYFGDQWTALVNRLDRLAGIRADMRGRQALARSFEYNLNAEVFGPGLEMLIRMDRTRLQEKISAFVESLAADYQVARQNRRVSATVEHRSVWKDIVGIGDLDANQREVAKSWLLSMVTRLGGASLPAIERTIPTEWENARSIFHELEQNRYFRAVGVGLLYQLLRKDCSMNCDTLARFEISLEGTYGGDQSFSESTQQSLTSTGSQLDHVLNWWNRLNQNFDGFGHRVEIPPVSL